LPGEQHNFIFLHLQHGWAGDFHTAVHTKSTFFFGNKESFTATGASDEHIAQLRKNNLPLAPRNTGGFSVHGFFGKRSREHLPNHARIQLPKLNHIAVNPTHRRIARIGLVIDKNQVFAIKLKFQIPHSIALSLMMRWIFRGEKSF